jgi:hypothetical protein
VQIKINFQLVKYKHKSNMFRNRSASKRLLSSLTSVENIVIVIASFLVTQACAADNRVTVLVIALSSTICEFWYMSSSVSELGVL